MLHDGIGVPRVGIEDLKGGKNTTKAVMDGAKAKGFLDPFQAVNKINDVEVSWTLGKMVLYASSEIPPPSEKALAVGFGSNVKGIPGDFQYPGGMPRPYESDDDWHRLFVEHPNRIPGFFIMIFIVVFIFFLILGKDKRAAAKQSLKNLFTRKQGKDPLHRKHKRGFAGKLLGGFGFGSGSSTTNYERVDLEDGDAVNEFELEEQYIDSSDEENALSDSSEGSKVGHTSGWATPRLNGEGTAGAPSYFGNAPGGSDVLGQGVGLGLGPPPGRIDVLSRTVSRERIKSRANSPKRGKGMSKLDE
jgi:Golgi apyrase